ncbi:MAG: serine/threonine protein kinase [Candidatus Magnetoglobus multicellularis str. Araruama]|uniref:Serine/threonine protein kinase n=1 Tax=Candidatus Magnetoglobus multicellularis str. Araruama TaxID=890399 RepID=A0A1V1PF15_9BACT|nr:MAG: serine/threonine protein kinase [Candidatus Magnetoglobus multicellularis str. Araruama]
MKVRHFTDTSDFYAIDCGDKIVVADRVLTVTGHERERRFGIEDPKMWVKRAEEDATGTKKIVKLSFLESFYTTLAGVRIRCFRNPDKEGQILSLVRDHPLFMQGEAYHDPKGNNIRIIDIVRGPNFFNYINMIRMDHRQYFFQELPEIMKKLIKAFEAIRFLHINDYRHGDIRNDHLIFQRKTGNYVWIDFDYDYTSTENPYAMDLFGLGNILLYAIGKGFHDLYMITNNTDIYGELQNNLEERDFSILDKWRFINLQKLFPYIPKMLNDILMHFSKRSNVYYETIDELLEDINRFYYSFFA